jgi:hypothetical protein
VVDRGSGGWHGMRRKLT